MSGKLGLPPLIVSQAQGSGPVFGIAADGSTTSGPLTVSAALAPELTAPTLRVTGRTDVNAVEVKGTADSANPALTVSDDDTLFLGPTAIYGGIQPSAKAVLELGSPAPEQHLLDITTVPGAQAPDVVVAQDGLVKLPTLNVNSAVAVQSISKQCRWEVEASVGTAPAWLPLWLAAWPGPARRQHPALLSLPPTAPALRPACSHRRPGRLWPRHL